MQKSVLLLRNWRLRLTRTYFCREKILSTALDSKQRFKNSKPYTTTSLSVTSIIAGATGFLCTQNICEMQAVEESQNQPRAEACRSKEVEELLYEFMVKMHCEGCAKAVRGTLEKIEGVSLVEIDLENEIVLVKSSLTGKDIVDILVGAGREARLIGSSIDGSLTGLLEVPASVGPIEENISSVAEFRGPVYGHGSVVGVVRIIQKSNKVAAVQATLGGLKADQDYSLAVHMFGDPRPGHQGKLFNGEEEAFESNVSENIGFLCTGRTDLSGQLEANNPAKAIRVWEIIGRGLVVHEGKNASNPLASSILARSAVVGANHKKVCTCDGTVIWEAS